MKQELCHKKREEKCAYSDADLATDLNEKKNLQLIQKMYV